MTEATEPELTGPQKAYNIAQSEMFQLAAYGHHRYHPLGECLTDEGKRQQRNYLDRLRAAREQLEAALLRLVAEHAETFRGDWGVPAAWLRSLADDPAALSLLAVRPDERDFDTAAAAPAGPAPATDRSAVLLAAADELGRMDYDTDSNDYGYDGYRDAWNGGVMDAADLLRRLAGEAQQDETGARSVPLAASCAYCGHRSDEHNRFGCCVGNQEVRCGCGAFVLGEKPAPIDPRRILGIGVDVPARVVQQDPTRDGEAHRCDNCGGVDPDSCLFNPNRPRPAVARSGQPDTD